MKGYFHTLSILWGAMLGFLLATFFILPTLLGFDNITYDEPQEFTLVDTEEIERRISETFYLQIIEIKAENDMLRSANTELKNEKSSIKNALFFPAFIIAMAIFGVMILWFENNKKQREHEKEMVELYKNKRR